MVPDRRGAYREWPAVPALAQDVACLWADDADSETAGDILVVPDACLDIFWDGSGLFVAGPDTGPVVVARRPGTFFAGLRFRPGRAPGFLGVAACELLDVRVELADLWGRPATERLTDHLHAARSADRAAEVLSEAVAARAGGVLAPDPLIDALVAWLSRDQASGGVVAAASRELGAGERRLRRRCSVAVGYGPKTLERVLRFGRAGRLASEGGSLAAVAAGAGYADQAHLARECRTLSGRSPSDLFKTAAPPEL